MKLSMLLSTITLATGVLSTGPARVVRGPASPQSSLPVPGGNLSATPAPYHTGSYYVAPTGGLSVTPSSSSSSSIAVASSKAPNTSVSTPSSVAVSPSSIAVSSSSIAASPSSAVARSSGAVASAPFTNSTAPLLRATGTGVVRPTRAATAKPSNGFASSTGSVPIPSASPLKNAAAVDIQLSGSVVALAVAMVVMVLQ